MLHVTANVPWFYANALGADLDAYCAAYNAVARASYRHDEMPPSGGFITRKASTGAGGVIIAGGAIMYQGFFRDETPYGRRFVHESVGTVHHANNATPACFHCSSLDALDPGSGR